MDQAPTRQASTLLIVAAAAMSLAWYASFLFSGRSADHPIAFGLLLVAEIIGMMQFLGLWLTIIAAPDRRESSELRSIRRALTTTDASRVPENLVAAFIPVVNEPIDVIRRTVIAARDMAVPHRTVILDDGPSNATRDLATELGVEYLRRDGREGRKAGNINNALARINTDYVAVFDADQIASSEFLLETLPHLLVDEKLAFVQTPQYYVNRDGYIAGGCAELHEVFYRHVQSAKNAFNAAFCVGTNVLFRRRALDDIGGMYDQSNSEDIWTSILLHERGWKTHFIANVLAVGLAPETVGDYLRQQFRWARGGLEIFVHHNPFRQRGLSFDQKLQYLHSCTHYLGGLSVFIFLLLPLLYAYLGWRPLRMDDNMLWFARFVPYFGMIVLSTVHLLGRWPRWRTIVVAFGAFPAHITALISVLTGFNIRWSVTGVITKQSDYVTAVAPQMLFFLLSVGAIPLAFARSEGLLLGMIVTGWLALASVLLFSFCVRAFPSFAAQRSDPRPSLQHSPA